MAAGDRSMRDDGLAAPHGPDMSGRHVATADLGDMSAKESVVFRSLLLPDDSHNAGGTYWADMPVGKRLAFVSKTHSAELAKELRSIARMIEADPLSPLSYYARNMIIPGAGLLLEWYVVDINLLGQFTHLI